jgi:hypothetical protein
VNAIESLVLRVRETQHPVTQLRISAPVTLIEQMICEFTARGETPEIDDEVVEFGPYISVHPDDDLPSDCFKIAVQK